MSDHCSERCSFERAAEVEFRGLAEDVHEIRDRVLRLPGPEARDPSLPPPEQARIQARTLRGERQERLNRDPRAAVKVAARDLYAA